jgi:hypothetical protein
MSYWWMSFCEPSKPRGTKFLGALIIKAENEIDLITRSWLLKLNPGGEIKFFKIPEKYVSRIPPEWVETRLITREECEALERKYEHSD